MQIDVHLDYDALTYCDGPVDARESLATLADRIREALTAAYPTAQIDVTYSSDTGGGGYTFVADDNGDELEDWLVVDDVRAVTDRAFENWDWVVPAAQ
jgi:hypothetical protein